MRLTMIGAVDIITGYGFLFSELFAGLTKRGIFVSIRATKTTELFNQKIPLEMRTRFVQGVQPEEWELAVIPPYFCPTPGKKTIYFTMWETTILPREYVENLNRSELVIVPCKWNKECFQNSGVTVPIVVIPLGYSSGIFQYSVPPKGKFTFGAAGRLSHGVNRKGVHRVIECFKKAFPTERNVNLSVKCQPDCPLPEISDSRIMVVREHGGWNKVKDWMASLNVFVSLSAGEGFGLWQLQAMASGRPVISPLFGGVTEFMTEENSIPVGFDLVKPDAEFKNGQWCFPKEKEVIQAMRLAVKSKGFESVGKQAALDASGFTWERTVEGVHKTLKNVGAI